MDFANFVTNYLNQKSEGDPSFMVSDESLLFVDLMRRDDMDRRASQASPATNPNERGEPSLEESAEQPKQQALSQPELETQPSSAEQEFTEHPAPATPVSEVALGTDTLQALSEVTQDANAAQPVSQPSSIAEPSEVFQEQQQLPESTSPGVSSQEALPADPLFESSADLSPAGTQPEASQRFSETSSEAEAADAVSEITQDIQPFEATRDSAQQDSQPAAAVSEDVRSAEAAQLFSESGRAPDPTSQLEDEGVRVAEINSVATTTTIIAPESMPDFEELLQRFDRNYRAPDAQVGDAELPEIELSESDPVRSSTERAESMISQFSSSLLNAERRRL